jgi:hypothetical protein
VQIHAAGKHELVARIDLVARWADLADGNDPLGFDADVGATFALRRDSEPAAYR